VPISCTLGCFAVILEDVMIPIAICKKAWLISWVGSTLILECAGEAMTNNGSVSKSHRNVPVLLSGPDVGLFDAY
jgi:hypothetical protein